MPRHSTRTIYQCVYCDREFKSETEAKRHESRDHDIVWLPVERSDLNRLLNFIAANDDNSGILTVEFKQKLFEFTKSR